MSIWDISRHLVVASLQMPFLPGFGVCISGAVLQPYAGTYRIWVPRLLFFLKQDLYPINVIRSLLIKSALRGTGTSRYKWG